MIYDWMEMPNYIELYYHMFTLQKFQYQNWSEWEETFKRPVNSISMWPVTWICIQKKWYYIKICRIYEKKIEILDHFNSFPFLFRSPNSSNSWKNDFRKKRFMQIEHVVPFDTRQWSILNTNIWCDFFIWHFRRLTSELIVDVYAKSEFVTMFMP